MVLVWHVYMYIYIYIYMADSLKLGILQKGFGVPSAGFGLI